MSRCRLLLIAALAVLLTVLLHPWVLPWMASWLIVDQRVPANASTVLLGGGDGQFDRAAELLSAEPGMRVLILDGGPGRLELLGILPTWPELVERELGLREVSADRLMVRQIEEPWAWDRIRRLDAWMAEHPDEYVVLLTDRFRSGGVDRLYRRLLDPAHYARLTIVGLPDRRYDESNWWRSRTGGKAMAGALADRLVLGWLGEQPIPVFDPDPDAYERRVMERWRQVAVSFDRQP